MIRQRLNFNKTFTLWKNSSSHLNVQWKKRRENTRSPSRRFNVSSLSYMDHVCSLSFSKMCNKKVLSINLWLIQLLIQFIFLHCDYSTVTSILLYFDMPFVIIWPKSTKSVSGIIWYLLCLFTINWFSHFSSSDHEETSVKHHTLSFFFFFFIIRMYKLFHWIVYTVYKCLCVCTRLIMRSF